MIKGLKYLRFYSFLGAQIVTLLSLWTVSFTALADEAVAPVEPVSCETTAAGGLSFDEIVRKMQMLASKTSNGKVGIPLSDADNQYFWNKAWPVLKVAAGESGISVAELLGNYTSILELVAENSQLFPKRFEASMAQIRLAIDMARQLEEIPANAKMKAKQWDKVASVRMALIKFGMTAFLLEQTWRETPSFDPLAPLTVGNLLKMLDSLENSTLDQMEEAHNRLLGISAQPQFDVAETSEPEQVATTLEPAESSAPDSSIDSLNFAQVLKNGVELSSSVVYQATTGAGQRVEVTISQDIVKESQGPQRTSVARLLKSIVTGRTASSGIKLLSDIGPHIIELKAVMHGHKRIIGCLKGNVLSLLKFMDIKDNKQTYAKRISPNLCQ